MALADALHVKSAEYWLQVGEPTQALLELQCLNGRSRRHPWTASVYQLATRALSCAGEETALAD